MKQRLLLFLLSFFTILTSLAAPIDKNNALKIARQFYQKQISFRSTSTSNLKLEYICKDDADADFRSTEDGNALYYVFNADKEQGFVIVAGDDKAGEVLAYSSSGNFSHSDMPDNLKSWMNNYKDVIKAIVNDEVSFDKWRSKTATTDTQYSPKVLPLLEREGIKWDQGEPYNRLCPPYSSPTRFVTGCVATAMSQVMRYYKHPERGVGYHEYTHPKIGKISANFDTVYDWDNMLPKYTAGKYNDVQAGAVAKLMHHVGVSVDMDYGPSSGTNTGLAKKALVEYFAYDKSIDFLNRKFYSSDEWNSIIKKELNEKRPVIYSGQNKGGGHAFICDGYDSNNLFHINWGWSGMSDGYFDLAILEPHSQGIGGTTAGYTFGQSILIGIQPEKANSSSERKYTITYDNIRTTDVYNTEQNKFPRHQTVRLYYMFLNMSFLDYAAGNDAVRVVLKDENSEHIIHTDHNLSILNYKGTGSGFDINIPQGFPNGSYKLGFKFKNPDSGEYFDGIAEQESFRDIDVEITGNSIEFKYNKVKPELEIVNQPIIKNGQLYAYRGGEISIDFKNKGKAAFRSKIALLLNPIENGTTTNQYTLFDDVILGIEPRENKTINFKAKGGVAAGDYILEVRYVTPNNEDKDAFPNATLETYRIKVAPEPADPRITISNVKIPTSVARGEKLKISLDVENRGGLSTGNVEIMLGTPVKDSNGYSTSLQFVSSKSVTVANNRKQEVNFELETESLVETDILLNKFGLHPFQDGSNPNLHLAQYRIRVYYNRQQIYLGQETEKKISVTAPINPALSCTLASLEKVSIEEMLSLDLPINNSGADYNDEIRFEFRDKQDRLVATVDKNYSIVKESTIRFKDNAETSALAPGTYTMNMLYKKDGEFIPMDGNYGYLEIEIPEAKLDVANASLEGFLEFRITEEFKYNPQIINMGTPFNDDIHLDIIPTEKLSASGQETVSIKTNLNVVRPTPVTAQFAFKLEGSGLKVGDYTLQLKRGRDKTAQLTNKMRSNQGDFINIGKPINLRILNADGTSGIMDNRAIGLKSLVVRQTNSALNIELPEGSNTLFIYDVVGQVIDKKEVRNMNSTVYDKTNMKNGLYLIVVEGLSGKSVSKVLVK